MELYLDSANLKEIEEGFKLGFLNGLTTTPTFMQREGITDIDGMIVKLSKIVPVLQIEALGDTAEDILKEAQRQLDLGLDINKISKYTKEDIKEIYKKIALECHPDKLVKIENAEEKNRKIEKI
jgi:transaldolase